MGGLVCKSFFHLFAGAQISLSLLAIIQTHSVGTHSLYKCMYIKILPHHLCQYYRNKFSHYDRASSVALFSSV